MSATFRSVYKSWSSIISLSTIVILNVCIISSKSVHGAPTNEVDQQHSSLPAVDGPLELVNHRCSCGHSQYHQERRHHHHYHHFRSDLPPVSARVVGGGESPDGRFPWMTGLLDAFGFNFCGGALISRRHVLTAAHCVHNKRATDIKVVIGETDVDLAYLFNRYHRVKSMVTHPGFVHANWSHDIAILTLATEADPKLEPICLPLAMVDFQRSHRFQRLIVAGWGRLASGNSLKPSKLHQVTLPAVDDARCEAAWFTNGVSSRWQLCAGAAGRDTCVYDSGSPLMDTGGHRSQVTLAGITSFGSSKCGEAGKPGVYTRVTSYMPFIRENTRSYCVAS